MVALQQDKISPKFLPKYVDYADIFLYNFATNIPENKKINENVIKLEKR